MGNKRPPPFSPLAFGTYYLYTAQKSNGRPSTLSSTDTRQRRTSAQKQQPNLEPTKVHPSTSALLKVDGSASPSDLGSPNRPLTAEAVFPISLSRTVCGHPGCPSYPREEKCYLTVASVGASPHWPPVSGRRSGQVVYARRSLPYLLHLGRQGSL